MRLLYDLRLFNALLRELPDPARRRAPAVRTSRLRLATWSRDAGTGLELLGIETPSACRSGFRACGKTFLPLAIGQNSAILLLLREF